MVSPQSLRLIITSSSNEVCSRSGSNYDIMTLIDKELSLEAKSPAKDSKRAAFQTCIDFHVLNGELSESDKPVLGRLRENQ